MRTVLLFSLALFACSHEDEGGVADLSGVVTGSDASVVDLASSNAGDTCKAPDVLVLLDRTGTMHRDLTGATPPDTLAGHQSSKLYQAITAIKGFVAITGIDQTLRLGLALFPQDPGGGMCLTLSQRLQGMDFSNPGCQNGQIVVPPALGTGAAIGGAIDPETTTLCFSTPTGNGLVTAKTELQSIKKVGVDQYVMLVTDGADFYDSCPTPDPMLVLRDLDAAGIRTFVVGFGSQDTTPQGVNPPLLNRMACAGHTAKSFATACTAASGGGYDAIDPNGTRLYYDASNASELSTALGSIATQLCCGCIL